MRHINNYRDGMITLDEMVERELRDCQYANNWLKDVLSKVLSKTEYSQAHKKIGLLMKEKAIKQFLHK